MSNRYEMIADAAEKAARQAMIDSGFPWCHNCDKYAEDCACKDPYIMEGETPTEPQYCTKCGKSREACRCKHPEYVKGE